MKDEKEENNPSIIRLYEGMSVAMFIHAVYRLLSMGYFIGPIHDSEMGLGHLSFGISVYAGLQLLVMAAEEAQKNVTNESILKSR